MAGAAPIQGADRGSRKNLRIAPLICASAASLLGCSGFSGIQRMTRIEDAFDTTCAERVIEAMPDVKLVSRIPRAAPENKRLKWAWSVAYESTRVPTEKGLSRQPTFDMWAGEEAATPGVVKFTHEYVRWHPEPRNFSRAEIDAAMELMVTVEAGISRTCKSDLARNIHVSCPGIECGAAR